MCAQQSLLCPMNISSIHSFALWLTIALLGLTSCQKEPANQINHTIVGTWESTTFTISECTNARHNIDRRSCDFSVTDDVDCGVREFRSDGIVMDGDRPLENALRYSINQDKLTLTDPQNNEMITFGFRVSADTLTLYLEEFNHPGCLLASHLVRVS